MAPKLLTGTQDLPLVPTPTSHPGKTLSVAESVSALRAPSRVSHSQVSPADLCRSPVGGAPSGAGRREGPAPIPSQHSSSEVA